MMDESESDIDEWDLGAFGPKEKSIVFDRNRIDRKADVVLYEFPYGCEYLRRMRTLPHPWRIRKFQQIKGRTICHGSAMVEEFPREHEIADVVHRDRLIFKAIDIDDYFFQNVEYAIEEGVLTYENSVILTDQFEKFMTYIRMQNYLMELYFQKLLPFLVKEIEEDLDAYKAEWKQELKVIRHAEEQEELMEGRYISFADQQGSVFSTRSTVVHSSEVLGDERLSQLVLRLVPRWGGSVDPEDLPSYFYYDQPERELVERVTIGDVNKESEIVISERASKLKDKYLQYHRFKKKRFYDIPVVQQHAEMTDEEETDEEEGTKPIHAVGTMSDIAVPEIIHNEDAGWQIVSEDPDEEKTEEPSELLPEEKKRNLDELNSEELDAYLQIMYEDLPELPDNLEQFHPSKLDLSKKKKGHSKEGHEKRFRKGMMVREVDDLEYRKAFELKPPPCSADPAIEDVAEHFQRGRSYLPGQESAAWDSFGKRDKQEHQFDIGDKYSELLKELGVRKEQDLCLPSTLIFLGETLVESDVQIKGKMSLSLEDSEEEAEESETEITDQLSEAKKSVEQVTPEMEAAAAAEPAPEPEVAAGPAPQASEDKEELSKEHPQPEQLAPEQTESEPHREPPPQNVPELLQETLSKPNSEPPEKSVHAAESKKNRELSNTGASFSESSLSSSTRSASIYSIMSSISNLSTPSRIDYGLSSFYSLNEPLPSTDSTETLSSKVTTPTNVSESALPAPSPPTSAPGTPPTSPPQPLSTVSAPQKSTDVSEVLESLPSELVSEHSGPTDDLVEASHSKDETIQTGIISLTSLISVDTLHFDPPSIKSMSMSYYVIPSLPGTPSQSLSTLPMGVSESSSVSSSLSSSDSFTSPKYSNPLPPITSKSVTLPDFTNRKPSNASSHSVDCEIGLPLGTFEDIHFTTPILKVSDSDIARLKYECTKESAKCAKLAAEESIDFVNINTSLPSFIKNDGLPLLDQPNFMLSTDSDQNSSEIPESRSSENSVDKDSGESIENTSLGLAPKEIIPIPQQITEEKPIKRSVLYPMTLKSEISSSSSSSSSQSLDLSASLSSFLSSSPSTSSLSTSSSSSSLSSSSSSSSFVLSLRNTSPASPSTDSDSLSSSSSSSSTIGVSSKSSPKQISKVPTGDKHIMSLIFRTHDPSKISISESLLSESESCSTHIEMDKEPSICIEAVPFASSNIPVPYLNSIVESSEYTNDRKDSIKSNKQKDLEDNKRPEAISEIFCGESSEDSKMGNLKTLSQSPESPLDEIERTSSNLNEPRLLSDTVITYLDNLFETSVLTSSSAPPEADDSLPTVTSVSVALEEIFWDKDDAPISSSSTSLAELQEGPEKPAVQEKVSSSASLVSKINYDFSFCRQPADDLSVCSPHSDSTVCSCESDVGSSLLSDEGSGAKSTVGTIFSSNSRSGSSSSVHSPSSSQDSAHSSSSQSPSLSEKGSKTISDSDSFSVLSETSSIYSVFRETKDIPITPYYEGIWNWDDLNPHCSKMMQMAFYWGESPNVFTQTYFIHRYPYPPLPPDPPTVPELYPKLFSCSPDIYHLSSVRIPSFTCLKIFPSISSENFICEKVVQDPIRKEMSHTSLSRSSLLSISAPTQYTPVLSNCPQPTRPDNVGFVFPPKRTPFEIRMEEAKARRSKASMSKLDKKSSVGVLPLAVDADEPLTAEETEIDENIAVSVEVSGSLVQMSSTLFSQPQSSNKLLSISSTLETEESISEESQSSNSSSGLLIKDRDEMREENIIRFNYFPSIMVDLHSALFTILRDREAEILRDSFKSACELVVFNERIQVAKDNLRIVNKKCDITFPFSESVDPANIYLFLDNWIKYVYSYWPFSEVYVKNTFPSYKILGNSIKSLQKVSDKTTFSEWLSTRLDIQDIDYEDILTTNDINLMWRITNKFELELTVGYCIIEKVKKKESIFEVLVSSLYKQILAEYDKEAYEIYVRSLAKAWLDMEIHNRDRRINKIRLLTRPKFCCSGPRARNYLKAKKLSRKLDMKRNNIRSLSHLKEARILSLEATNLKKINEKIKYANTTIPSLKYLHWKVWIVVQTDTRTKTIGIIDSPTKSLRTSKL